MTVEAVINKLKEYDTKNKVTSLVVDETGICNLLIESNCKHQFRETKTEQLSIGGEIRYTYCKDCGKILNYSIDKAGGK